MKSKFFLFALIAIQAIYSFAQEPVIKLDAPDLTRGKGIMKALKLRQSTRECSAQALSSRDLSDLLWAANGINREGSKKRTAPSAMNKQDIKVYACLKEGSYLYNPNNHSLELVSKIDARWRTEAPIMLVLVADEKTSFGPIDAGIVSQNISLFCSGIGLATVCRGSMDREALVKALKLSEKQDLLLNHPVGYFK